MPATESDGKYDTRTLEDLVDLYRALDPKTARESLLVGQLLAVNNASMDCYARAARCNELAARDLNLKYAMKGAAHVVELIDALDRSRAKSTDGVIIGNVNVEAGAQAIVGKVQVRTRREDSANGSCLPELQDDDGDG
jgi:hypothetical protein